MVVASILVIVLSLLTVGFAEMMRHSQQQELNNHLANQAYFAAESGINDAIRALNNGFNFRKTDCGVTKPGDAYSSAPGSKYLYDNHVSDPSDDSTASSIWSCLLIDPWPSSLQYDSIDTTTPKSFIFVPVGTNGGTNPFKKLTLNVSWQDTDGSNTNFRGNTAPTSGDFPTAANWNSVGMLKFTITPLSDMTPDGLIKNAYTVYLYPNQSASSGPASATYKPDDKGNTVDTDKTGNIINGNCNLSNTPHYCSATIDGLPDTGEAGYLVSMRSIYSPTSVYIKGIETYSNGSVNGVNFSGAQSLIDSTGKVLNQLKRISVRVPNRPDYPYPGFSAEAAGSICKKLDARPGSMQMGGPGNCLSSAIVGGGSSASPGVDYGGCPGSPSCPPSGGGGGTPAISYWIHLVNTTSNPDATASSVSFCLWDFGDGSPTQNTACYTGQDIKHEFLPGGTAVPPKCYRYTVTLTINYKSGEIKTKSTTYNMPAGTSSPC